MPRRTLARRSHHRGRRASTPARASPRSACPPSRGRASCFRRIDLPGAPEVPARLAQVRATERRTALGEATGTVQTVEHLLAAAAALELDDLIVELDGPEPPIGDGSFAAVPDGAAHGRDRGPAGRSGDLPGHARRSSSPRAMPPTWWRRPRPPPHHHHRVGPPADRPAVGQLRHHAGRLRPRARRGADLRLRARSGGAAGPGAGARAPTSTRRWCSRTTVWSAATLRWPDEFVRHKAGDILGDLALVGGRVQAHVVASKPSHQGNIALARWLRRTGQRVGGVAMDIGRILDVIPHRYPFLLVDRIIEVEGTDADRRASRTSRSTSRSSRATSRAIRSCPAC